MEEGDIMNCLCEELVEEILCRVPIKPRIRMKCVSKGWYQIISNLTPRRTETGLFIYDVTEGTSTITFLRLEGSEHCFRYNSIHLSLNKTGVFPARSIENLPDWGILASCNGLLLCLYGQPGCRDYFICNPILKKWFALPRNCRNSLTWPKLGLAFDGFNNGHGHYKVIHFSREDFKLRRGVDTDIFSSEKGEWINHRAELLNSTLLQGMSRKNFNSSSFYRRGIIYWNCGNRLLLYLVKKKCFKLMRLPINDDGTIKYSSCLWGCEGRLHYCNSEEKGFNIWTYVGNNQDLQEAQGDDQVTGAKAAHKWRMKLRVNYDILMPQHPENFAPLLRGYTREVVIRHMEPVTFNEELQVLYLHLPGTIVSYSLETQKLKEVWSHGCPSFVPRVYPFVYNNSGNLPVIGADCKLLEPKFIQYFV